MPRSGIVGREIENNCSPSYSSQRERKIARDIGTVGRLAGTVVGVRSSSSSSLVVRVGRGYSCG